MVVVRDLVRREGDTLRAALCTNAPIAEPGSLTHVNRHATAQVRQAESGAPVATVDGAKQAKQGVVLTN